MKIVFLGTPDFAVPVLEALFASEHTVSLVVTQPDREKGRGQNVAISPVKACALQKGLPVFQPEKIKAEEATARLRTEQADAFVVAAYGQLLSEELLAMPRFGCLNVHASLLPALRGAAPIQWAVLNGDAQSGITIMQMDKGMDTGDILLQKTVDLAADETAESLYQKLSERGGPLLLQALSLAEAGALRPIRQSEVSAEPTYAPLLTKEAGLVRWERSATEIERQLRGLYPWPGAYTALGKKRLRLWSGQVVDETAEHEVPPGTVLSAVRGLLDVACGTGVLRLVEVQLEGKKRMTAEAFLLGHPLSAGDRLGQ